MYRNDPPVPQILAICVALGFSSALFAGQAERAEAPDAESLAIKRAPVDLPKAERDVERVAALTEAINLLTAENHSNTGQLVQLLDQRAKQHMRAQDWTAAAADFQQAKRLQPQDSMHWMRAAVLLQMAGNPMQYDEFSDDMLQHFKETENPWNAERAAKMCWLPRPPVDKQGIAEKLGDLAVRQRQRQWGEYFSSTRALGHFRHQQYDDALKQIADSDRRNTAKPEPRVDLTTINGLLKTMCLARLGRDDEADAAMEVATAAMTKTFKNPELLYTSPHWNDWLLAKLLHDEAIEMLAEDSPVAVATYDSPEAAFAGAKRAHDTQDWQTFMTAHDDNMQTHYVALALISTFVYALLDNDAESQKKWLSEVEAVCREHHDKSPVDLLGNLTMFGKLNFSALNAKQHKKLVDYATAATDKPKLVAEINRLLTKQNDGKRVTTIAVYQGTLTTIETNDDSAVATVDVGEDAEPIVLHFRKDESGWAVAGIPQPDLPDLE